MQTGKCCFGLILFTTFIVGQASPTRAADPVPDAPPAVWGGGNLHIPFDSGSALTSALSPLPNFAMVGATLWNLRTGQAQGPSLDPIPGRQLPSALSTDGALFACVAGEDNVFEHDDDKRLATAAVTLWSTSTGQPIASLKSTSIERRPQFIAFCGPSAKTPSKWLIVIGRDDRPQKTFGRGTDRADVWDVATSKVHHSFNLAQAACGVMTVSPDGGYLGVIAQDHVHVYDIRGGREAAVMKDPPADPLSKPVDDTKATGQAMKAHQAQRNSHALLPRFNEYSWSGGLAFSPNGREIAGLFSGMFLHKPNRLIIWDSSGHVTFDSGGRQIAGDFGGDQREGLYRNLQWSPDASQLLLAGGWLVDRKTGVTVCHVMLKDGERQQPIFLDDHRLLALRSDAWEPCEIPTSDIKASLTALSNAKVGALLRPGQQVNLSVDIVGNVRGDAGQTKENLTTAMTAALTGSSFTIGDTQTARFHVSYKEAVGRTAEIYESRNMVPFGGKDTGQKATGTDSTVTIELKINESDQPVWSQQLKGYSPQAMASPVNDDTLRAAMLKSVCWQLSRLVVPTFVPADPSIKSLPIVEE